MKKKLTTIIVLIALALPLAGCSVLPIDWLNKPERIQQKAERLANKVAKLNEEIQRTDAQLLRNCVNQAGSDLDAAKQCFNLLGESE